MSIKTAFIHSSAGPNKLHKKYANSIEALLFQEDQIIPIYNQSYFKPFILFGWIINAIKFYKLRKYNYIITDSFKISVTIAKYLRIIDKKQKIIIFFGSEQLIKLESNDYSRSLTILYKLSLKKSYAFINLGVLNHRIIHATQSKKPSQIIFNGIEEDKLKVLLNISPKFSRNVFFILANILSVERAKIKGLDIAIKSFLSFKKRFNMNAELKIGGEISPEVFDFLNSKFSPNSISTINFFGKINDLPNFLSNCSFGLNLSRYDAWSLVVNESLLSGIPIIVSNKTGSIEMVKSINANLIVKSEDINDIVQKMYWLCNLDQKERKMLSEKGRMVSKKYTEEKALLRFQNTFNYLIS